VGSTWAGTVSCNCPEAQRAAVAGRRCIVCGTDKRVDAAHLTPRSLGGCGDARCCVPLCRADRRRYDAGELDLLPYLEPAWRAQLAHAVGHVGLIAALRRISGANAFAWQQRAVERIGESEPPATTMTRKMANRQGSKWTPEERAREERARAIRARQDRDKGSEERLEETLRLSRLMSELQQGAARDVPGR
jgi:hypothetical protein